MVSSIRLSKRNYIGGQSKDMRNGRVTVVMPSESLPLTQFVANCPGVNLQTWLSANRDRINDSLLHDGVILLRGFDSLSVEEVEAVITLIDGQKPQPYFNRSTPRSTVHNNIYTSTEYPPDQVIPQHNENSYSASWPERLTLYCQIPAANGGQTPLADSRKVFAALPDSLTQKFIDHGVKYVRHYSALGLSWQDTFQTESRAEVEQYCRDNDILFEWNDQGHLRTEQICPAAITHPRTREWVWFNQAHLFHLSNLGGEMAEAMTLLYPQKNYPRNAYLGNGEELDEQELALIRDAYDRFTFSFDWQCNDLVIVDNMLFSHGRMPFTGERRILVGMTGNISAREWLLI